MKINSDKSKMFLIIDDTHEKFAFKSFSDGEGLKEFFTNLNNSDFYEDISFSVRINQNYILVRLHKQL